MKKIIFAISLFFPTLILADVPANQQKEVSHLLNFVKDSKCIINRNGTDYDGKEAVKHIEDKYNYFRDKIKNTEDFIKYSATKSTMSGKFYMVTCTEKKSIKTQNWLLDELKRYRATEKLSDSNEKKKTIVCTEPRPQICTMQYMPVCAILGDGSTKTYATDCSACSDARVVSYSADACK